MGILHHGKADESVAPAERGEAPSSQTRADDDGGALRCAPLSLLAAAPNACLRCARPEVAHGCVPLPWAKPVLLPLYLLQ
eukprot:COSAG02_NODE_238_length_27685_cov_11.570792_12_plen_80_part_00